MKLAMIISAWLMACVALMFGPRPTEFEAVKARLAALESRKCLLMAVNTPSGVTSICAAER